MSRCTQYVGLNGYARAYVKGATRTEKITQITTGMFSEPVSGTRYFMPVPIGPNKEYWLDEEVQMEPWSSGPMIFTCLRGWLIKECGQKIDMGRYFEWMLDPSVNGQEYDVETGRFFI